MKTLFIGALFGFAAGVVSQSYWDCGVGPWQLDWDTPKPPVSSPVPKRKPILT